MPDHALRKVEVDHCVSSAELAGLLIRLVSHEANQEIESSMSEKRKTAIEVGIAGEDEGLSKGVLELGHPSIYACPECHGVLLQITEGKIIRFRCHTGHAYSSGTLLATLTGAIEETLWNSVRAYDESRLLLSHLSSHLRESDAELALLYEKEASAMERSSQTVRHLALESGQIGEM
jgi:two-component system, chemotaxis family, protein-glutamate methylesterase/glutaminase